MEAVREALLKRLPPLLQDRARDVRNALDGCIARDLLRPEPLGADERIFITGYKSTRRVRVVCTPAFTVLDVDVIAEPRRDAEVWAAAYEFVVTAQAEEDARSFCREDGCRSAALGTDGSGGRGSSEAVDSVARRVARQQWCDSVPTHPLYRRLCHVLAALVCGGGGGSCGNDGDEGNAASTNSGAVAVVEALKLPASPLLEALEVQPLGTYIDSVVDILSSCARAAAAEGGGGNGRGRDGRHNNSGGGNDDDVNAPVKLALAVARQLSSKQIMALLGMRHTRASPEWVPAPPYAALYSVSAAFVRGSSLVGLCAALCCVSAGCVVLVVVLPHSCQHCVCAGAGNC